MPPEIDYWSQADHRALREATTTLATLAFCRGGGLSPPDLSMSESSRNNNRAGTSRRPYRVDDLNSDIAKLAMNIHGLAPLFGQRVQADEITFGDELDTWLVEQFKRNIARLTRMRDELLVTLNAFERASIDIIPLKGTAMILEDLNSVAWRPMSDLDLLVRCPDEQQLDLAFAHAGYCLHDQSWKHRQYGPCDPGRRVLHTDGEHPDNPRDIESHPAVVEMFRGFRWDITPWITNNLYEINGVRLPTPQAMSLHLAVHMSISVFEATTRMIQVFDFARVVERSGVDAIRQAVEKSGIDYHARFVYPAVALAARWSGNTDLAALERDLRPYVPPALPNWLATVDFHSISWAGREQRGVLDRLDLWAHNPLEQLRMLSTTLAPSPGQLASAGYSGSGPLAVAGWYPRHYRHLLRRLRA